MDQLVASVSTNLCCCLCRSVFFFEFCLHHPLFLLWCYVAAVADCRCSNYSRCRQVERINSRRLLLLVLMLSSRTRRFVVLLFIAFIVRLSCLLLLFADLFRFSVLCFTFWHSLIMCVCALHLTTMWIAVVTREDESARRSPAART